MPCTVPMSGLGGDANHSTGRASASIASLQRLLVATLAQVISARVQDNGALQARLEQNPSREEQQGR